MTHLQVQPQHDVDSGAPAAPGLDATRQLDAVVVAVMLDFNQVRIRDGSGRTYALTRRTPGVNIDELREGQRVRCTVKRDYPLVLEAAACA